MKGLEKIKSSYIEIIDDSHANSYQAWLKMGSPDSLLPSQVEALENASKLIKESIDVKQKEESIFIELAVEPQSTICITLEIL